MTMSRLEPQTGTAFELRAGQLLRVIDLEGEQVADLMAFNFSDKAEWLSSGGSDLSREYRLWSGKCGSRNRCSGPTKAIRLCRRS